MDAAHTPHEHDAAASPETTWAASALILTAVVGLLAKALGVLVFPGMRGVASQKAMVVAEVASASLGYVFAALLVALLCGGAFELARARKIGVTVRGAVVAISGLVVALASPSVVQRLHTPAAIALALVASIVVGVGGVAVARSAHTRALGALLVMLALSGVMRPLAWILATIAGERASLGLYHFARAISTGAVSVQALAALLAAAWLGTRSKWRGRMLANGAIILAFVITYLAARETDAPPSTVEAVLRGSLGQASIVPSPYALASIAAFLVPASILLAGVALLQRVQPTAILCALALAVLSQGSFEVPLQALAAVVATQWALLAMVDERANRPYELPR